MAKRTSEERKYFIGAMIVLGVLACFMLIFVSLAVTTLRHSGRATANVPLNPGAALFVPGQLRGDFSFSAVVDVPTPAPVRSEPSLQIEARAPSGIWEAGIMRTPQHSYAATPFIVYLPRGRSVETKYFRVVNDGPHRITLRRVQTAIVFLVDDREVYRFPGAPMSLQTQPALDVGTYLGVAGEPAIGSIADIEISGDLATGGHAQVPRCSLAWGGVSLINTGSHWTLGGSYDPSRRHTTQTFCVNTPANSKLQQQLPYSSRRDWALMVSRSAQFKRAMRRR